MPVRARIGSPNKLALAFGVSMAVVLCLVALAGVIIARAAGSAIRDQATAGPRTKAPQIAARVERGAVPLTASSPARLPAAVRRAVPPEEATITIADSSGRMLYPVSVISGQRLPRALTAAAAADGGAGLIVPSAVGRAPDLIFPFAPRPARSGDMIVVSLPYGPIAAGVSART